MASPLTSLEMRLVDAVLQMGEGYVLDFADRTFREFFEDYDIDIDDSQYCVDGTSKARRLRRFLRSSEPELAARVLDALLAHRLASSRTSLRAEDEEAYRKIVARLERAGEPQPVVSDGRDAILGRSFDPTVFRSLPFEPHILEVLIARMNEAQTCVQAGANLAAVILSGSVLEGLCLGFGKLHVEHVTAAFREQFPKRRLEPIESWALHDWITVLRRIEVLSPNVEKFGHALREFRNYVHPHHELFNSFSPDHNTAAIAFQVVVAAAEEILRSAQRNG